MEHDFVESNLARQAIDAARLVTDVTGGLHEFQAKQLKLWPLLLLDGAKSCEIGIDIGSARQELDDEGNMRRQNRPVRIEYHVSTDLEHTPEHTKAWSESVARLIRFTQELFWPDTDVMVLIDNHRIEAHE